MAALWFVASVAAVEDAGGADAGIDPSVLVLHDAARFGSLEAVERVLARQPGAVDTPEPGAQLTPLMVAARAGHVRVVQRLIAGGADVNAMAAGHGTALSIAAWNNRPEVVRVLLDAGADPNARTAAGRTPLMFAARNSDDAVATLDLLMKGGAEPDARDARGDTAFTFATASENGRTADRLRDAGHAACVESRGSLMVQR